MKFPKLFLGAALLVAVSGAFAAKTNIRFADNRRDASCATIVGDCADTGPNTCQTFQYPLSDNTCHLRLLKRP